MDTIEATAKALGVPVRRFRDHMAWLGFQMLVSEAERLQAHEAWDKGPDAIAANIGKTTIEQRFGKAAYEQLCQQAPAFVPDET